VLRFYASNGGGRGGLVSGDAGWLVLGLWEVWLVADKIGEKLEQRSGRVRLDWLDRGGWTKSIANSAHSGPSLDLDYRTNRMISLV
jgi:hypothetical protein